MRRVVLAGLLLSACAAKPRMEGQTSLAEDRVSRAPPARVHCPPDVFERMRTVDLTDPENSALFGPIGSASVECQVEALWVIAGRVDPSSDAQVVGDFCGAAATLSRFLPPEARDDVRAAYLRFPYSEPIHLDYFLGLRLNRIDLRGRLAGAVAVDWTFTHPRQDAATWHYFMYLAVLGEPGAYAKLAAKIAATTNGNDATNLLKSIAELGTEPVREILQVYASDTRRADGASGPGMTIAETVALLLTRYFQPRP